MAGNFLRYNAVDYAFDYTSHKPQTSPIGQLTATFISSLQCAKCKIRLSVF